MDSTDVSTAKHWITFRCDNEGHDTLRHWAECSCLWVSARDTDRKTVEMWAKDHVSSRDTSSAVLADVPPDQMLMIDDPTTPTMDGIERARYLTEAEIDERWCDWYYHHGKMRFSRCIHPKHGDNVPHEHEGQEA